MYGNAVCGVSASEPFLTPMVAMWFGPYLRVCLSGSILRNFRPKLRVFSPSLVWGCFPPSSVNALLWQCHMVHLCLTSLRGMCPPPMLRVGLGGSSIPG